MFFKNVHESILQQESVETLIDEFVNMESNILLDEYSNKIFNYFDKGVNNG